MIAFSPASAGAPTLAARLAYERGIQMTRLDRGRGTPLRWLVGTAALTAVLALTACGGGSHTNDAGGDSAGNGFSLGPELTVTFDVTGEAELKGTATTSAPTMTGVSPESCGDYANGSAKENGRVYYTLPQLFTEPVAGKRVLVGASVADYDGPGTYQLDQLSGEGTPPGVEVDDRPYVDQPDTSSGELVTDGDGGGTWTFTRLAFSDGNGEVSEGISGQITWTCENG